jgi:CHAT domain-containing protein
LGTLAQTQGARSVIATLWQVADVGTGEFMRRLYQKRAEGLTKAEALRRGQVDFIQHGDSLVLDVERGKRVVFGDSKSRPDAHKDRKTPYAHPYFWAPFILMMGNGCNAMPGKVDPHIKGA